MSSQGARQAVEMARYLLLIEGDSSQAQSLLGDVIRSSREGGALAMAKALMGELSLAQGKDSLAAVYWRNALASTDLSRNERNRLTRKLLAIDPGAVQSLTALAPTPGPITSVHSPRWRTDGLVLLEVQEKHQALPTLWLQRSDGTLSRLPLALKPGQALLDAAGNLLLILDAEAGRLEIHDFSGRLLRQWAAGDKTEVGRLLNPRGDAAVWLEGSRLHLLRRGDEWSEYHVEGPCDLNADATSGDMALLLCSDQTLYRADFASGQVKPMGRLAEKPLSVALRGDILLLQYADHIEARRGPRFDAFSWGFPCQLRDRIALGDEQAYLVDPKGGVRAFDLRNGQAAWQRDLMAQEALPLDDGVLVKTFGQTLEALDARGLSLWSYAFGWGDDPMVLPWGRKLLLGYSQGQRILIDRDIARAARKPGDLMLKEALSPKNGTPEKQRAALETLLALEPGQGEAWRQSYALDRQLGASAKQLTQDLMQSARSSAVPPWSNHPVLKALSSQMGATWAFKREYGPKYYPTFIPGQDLAFYLESDNQTLVILDPTHGTLVNSYRFAEELDLKAALWRGDTLCVSSSTRLYLVSPWRRSGLLAQYPLRSPLCQALSLPQGLLLSDWRGNLSLMNMATGEMRWEKKIGEGGLLLGKPPGQNQEWIDVTDLEGHYFGVQASTGKVLGRYDLPAGTPIEAQSLPQGAAIAMAQGRLLLVGRQTPREIWQRDIGEQIFSLTGNRSETLVLTTASKRVLCLRSVDGGILSDQRLSAYLFNRPWVSDTSFWIGTTDPSLEQRSFRGRKIASYPLSDLPGSPASFRNLMVLGTLDHLIMAFPGDGKSRRDE